VGGADKGNGANAAGIKPYEGMSVNRKLGRCETWGKVFKHSVVAALRGVEVVGAEGCGWPSLGKATKEGNKGLGWANSSCSSRGP